MESRLANLMSTVREQLRQVHVRRELAFCWFVTAAAELILLGVQAAQGRNSRAAWGVILLAGLTASLVAWRRHRQPVGIREAVSAIEESHPEARHLLSAAVEQEPEGPSAGFRYLQLRVIEEVLAHPRRAQWLEALRNRTASARSVQVAAVLAMAVAAFVAAYSSHQASPLFASWWAKEITVVPGDIAVERGTSLVVTARFGGKPPAEADLVFVTASGKTLRLPLERHLADPVFGASLTSISEDGRYHVEYAGKSTEDYRIGVFEYPALAQADARLQYPAYTGLTNRLIRDTRRVSAVQDTRLTYTFQLNKPVALARLVASNQPPILLVRTNSQALLEDWVLTNSARFNLELTDADGRSNKFPIELSMQALPNRRPELKFDFPHGDQRVSALEELHLQAEAVDDFGLLRYGVGYARTGQETQFIELGKSAPGHAQRRFDYLLPLEQLQAQPDEVVSYFIWAEDDGPDGKPRRTVSDVYFAEVRPFEEVFRPDDSGSGGAGGQGQPDSAGQRLAQMQKQIAIATWKLQQPGATTSP
jgi:hypothetical protein